MLSEEKISFSFTSIRFDKRFYSTKYRLESLSVEKQPVATSNVNSLAQKCTALESHQSSIARTSPFLQPGDERWVLP